METSRFKVAISRLPECTWRDPASTAGSTDDRAGLRNRPHPRPPAFSQISVSTTPRPGVRPLRPAGCALHRLHPVSRQRSDRGNAPWRLAAAWPFRWGRKFRPVAMSVLASGAIDPREAIEYVRSQKKIESIVFGASSKSNILNTKRLIDEYIDEYSVASRRLRTTSHPAVSHSR